jgi:hypothetical protein
LLTIRFKDVDAARDAINRMNNFNLNGRAIRMGLVEEVEPEPKGPGAERLRRSGPANLDDTDTSGISYNRVSRTNLMKKLMREEDTVASVEPSPQQAKPVSPSLCVILGNMFDSAE